MAGGPNGSVYISGLVREPIDWFWETSWRPPYQTGLDPQVPNFPIENAQRYLKSVNLNGTNWVYDNFEAAALDSVLWSQTEIFYGYPLEGSISQSGGALTLTSGNGVAAPTAKGMVTNYIYDLTVGGGRSVYARVTISNANDNNYNMFVGKAGNYRLGIEIASGSIRLAYYAPDGRITASSSAAVGASFDGWIRLRYDHSALTFYLDTATTGASNPPIGGDWTNQRAISKFPAHDTTCQSVGFSIANSFGAGTTTMVVGSINVGTAAAIPNESISATASLVAVKVFLKTLSISTTLTFSLVTKWVGKGLSTTASASTAMIKSVGKLQSISSTLTFSIVKSTSKWLLTTAGGFKTPAISSTGTLLQVTGASGAVAMPTYAAGDIVVVGILYSAASQSGLTTAAPAGWDTVLAFPSSISSWALLVYARRMDGSEGSSVTFTWNGTSTSRGIQARAVTIQNVVETGTYFETALTNEGSTTTVGADNLTSAAITTLGDTRLILNYCGTTRGVDNTQTEGADAWTDDYLNATYTTPAVHLDSALSYQLATTRGAYSAETRTKNYSSGGSLNWGFVSFAIIPAFAGPAPTIARATNKFLMGAAAVTISIVRAVSRVISPQSTPSTVVVKSTSRAMSISSTDTATVTRSAGKIVAVVASTSGVVSRAVSKVIVLAADVAATVRRSINKIIVLAADAAAVLDAQFSGSGGTEYDQTVGISSTPSFSIVRSTAHLISLAASVTMSIIRSTGKGVSYATDLAVSIGRAISKGITSSSTSSSVILRVVARIAEADASTVQSISRSTSRTLALAASVSAAIFRLISRTIGSSTTPTFEAYHAPGRNIGANASSAQTISRTTARTTAADATTTQGVIKSTAKAAMVGVATAQNLIKVTGKFLSLVTTESAFMITARLFQRSFIAAVSSTQSIGRLANHILTSLVDAIASIRRAKDSVVQQSTTPTARIDITAFLQGISATVRRVVASWLNRLLPAGVETRTLAVETQNRSTGVSVQVRSVAADNEERAVDTSQRIE